ncbi:hypothetical protein LEP1GSC036_0442 [Leptospira weilii str. 2006001853]|uniref:Uncharacterized protein n=1 Tax=Leptospira weilii str. 2006001853 TaxID=1001589 RepID=A0A828Z6E8_9LEPT|nr:hypothetical protein LEP1GSC036_0442 [Leptospira weilii str. 2006001853]EMN44831.1 hypothetical protein LEP1GSC086_0704 [Leptospira weilii str. LNT 1234]
MKKLNTTLPMGRVVGLIMLESNTLISYSPKLSYDPARVI